MPDHQRVEYVGPRQTTDVVLDGRRVPFLAAEMLRGGVISIVADGRFALDLTIEEAERVVPFLAHAIAIAMGYSCHPRADETANALTPFPRVSELPLTALEHPA
jgi:hypothetical protein